MLYDLIYRTRTSAANKLDHMKGTSFHCFVLETVKEKSETGGTEQGAVEEREFILSAVSTGCRLYFLGSLD